MIGPRLLAACAVMGLAGCAASNVADLRQHPTGTLTAHSPDSVPITARRVADGLERCGRLTARAQVYGPDMPADVTVETPSMMGGVSANAHLTPGAPGTDAQINYKHAAWRDTAKRMQSLVNGELDECER